MSTQYVQFPSASSGGTGSGVSSLNSLTGALTLAAGTNITITPSGSVLTIASTGGGGGVSSVSVVTGNGFAGTVATATTTPAITISTTVTGILKGNGTAISAATAGTDYVVPSVTTLSSLSLPTSQLTGTLAATQFPALTGDVTTTAGNLATTLATVNSNVGSFTNANITVNAKGIITAASSGSAGFTNPMTTFGDLIYENATPAAARLAGNTSTTQQFLSQTGTGSNSAAPVWSALVSANIPNNAANTSGTAANITATSNSSLTTLSSLSLPVSQLTGTLPVANGGTGDTSFTAYAPVLGGTTSTGALQSASSGISNVGYVLTSTGSSSAPTWQAGSGSQANPIVLSQISTPSSPASGSNDLYFKSDGNLYTLNSSGVETLVGGASAVYADAYFGPNSTWQNATGTATLADPTYTGSSDTLTVRKSNGLTLTAAASNVAGITFTPASSSAVYLIYAQIGLYTGNTNATAGAQLTDGTTVISSAAGFLQSGATASGNTITIGGIYAPATTSAVTVKVQIASGNGGTVNLQSEVSFGNTIEWTVVQIPAAGAGSSNSSIITVTTSTTLATTNNFVRVNSASATTITLPASGAGQVFNIKNVNTGTVTVTPTSGTIDGATSASITSPGSGIQPSIEVVFDGSNWNIF